MNIDQLFETAKVLNQAIKEINLLMENILKVQAEQMTKESRKRTRYSSHLEEIANEPESFNVTIKSNIKSKCKFCKKLHSSKECRTYQSTEERRARLERMNLCKFCYKQQHPKRCEDESTIQICVKHNMNEELCTC